MSSSSLTLQPSGQSMPLVGLGTWKIPNDVCADIVYSSLKVEYRHLDCACDYGNEVEVGQGIKRALDEKILTREELFVTSKLWNSFHHPENVREAFEKTRSDLGLDYLDLYLVHFPISLEHVPIKERYPPGWKNLNDKFTVSPVPFQDTWREMEKLVNDGLAKNIGVANFSASLIMDLLSYAKIKPAVNQVEIHPYLTQPKLIEYLQKQGIVVTGYSSFGPISYVPIFEGDETVTEAPSLLNECDLLKNIANAHSKTVAQVILRWNIQRNIIVIPKSSKEERLVENKDIFDFELTDDEMKQISKLDRNLRFNDPGRYVNYPIFD